MSTAASSMRSLPGLAALAAGLMGVALVLSFFVAPEDADQGISQRIFYIHVPIALTAYFCFGLGAWKALLLLWRATSGTTWRATSRSTRERSSAR